MQLPKGKSRLDLVKEGVLSQNTLPKRGRFIVAIHRLLEDPRNERRTYRGMEGLIASVKIHGIVEPITVTPDGEHFRILTGHRRYSAAKAAGLIEVEVISREPEDELTRRRKSIVSNVQREDIGAVELAEALHSLLEEDDNLQTQRQLAALIGKSEQWVSDMLRILKLPAKLQERIRTAEISVAYDSAMRIASCQDAALQQELVSAALKGESSRTIRGRLAAHKAGAGRGAGKAQPKNSFLTFTETCEDCTATVRGPDGSAARRSMRTALKRLLKQLGSGDSASGSGPLDI